MVLFRGEVHQLALEAPEHHGGQGGELQAAGGQLHPGYGPEAASVSTGPVSTDSFKVDFEGGNLPFWVFFVKNWKCNWSSWCLAHD